MQVEPEFKPRPLELVTDPPDGTTALEFSDCVMAGIILWQSHKIKPNATDMLKLGLLKHHIKVIRACINSDEFAIAMQRRGIPWGNVNNLSARQIGALQFLTNPLSGGSFNTRLKRAGVAETEFVLWRQNPYFEREWKNLNEGILTEWTEAIDLAIVQGAIDGKLENAKYINELTGRHDPAKQKALDVELIVRKVIEVVQTRLAQIDAPASVVAQIGTDLMGILEGRDPLREREPQFKEIG